jgi:hypothetical protein
MQSLHQGYRSAYQQPLMHAGASELLHRTVTQPELAVQLTHACAEVCCCCCCVVWRFGCDDISVHFLQVYVVGERGIMEELAAVGIASCGGPDDNDKRASFSSEMQHDTQVGWGDFGAAGCVQMDRVQEGLAAAAKAA